MKKKLISFFLSSFILFSHGRSSLNFFHMKNDSNTSLDKNSFLVYKELYGKYYSDLFFGDLAAYDLSENILVKPDSNKVLTVEKIISDLSGSFQKISGISLLSSDLKVFWLKFTLQNNLDNDFSGYFFFNSWAKIDFYELDCDNRISLVKQSGNALPLHERDTKIRRIPYIYFEINKGLSKQIIVRLERGGAEQWLDDYQDKIPVILFNKSDVVEYEKEARLVIGIILGIVIIVSFFNIIFYIRTNDKSALYNAIILISWEGFFLTSYGLSFELLWPENVLLDLSGNSIFTVFCTFGFYRFLYSNLIPDSNDKNYNRIINILSYLVFVNLVTEFLDLAELNKVLTHFFYGQVFILSLLIYLKQARIGVVAARYYFTATLFILIVQVIVALAQMRLIASSYIYCIQFIVFQCIAVIHVILFSIGLIEKYKQRKLESIEFQKRNKELFLSIPNDIELHDFLINKNIVSQDLDFFKQLILIVREHIADSDFNVKSFADKMAMSQSALYRRIKRMTDLSPAELIRDIRLQFAEKLLADGTNNVALVANQVGFISPSYFAKIFKEKYGLSPFTYQRLKSGLVKGK